ncbi:MAG: hypothetical protein R6V28_09070 [Nitriliruptoraceae bacterium]
MTAADTPPDGVALRSLLAGGLPLLVASVTAHGRGPQLHAALTDAGLAALPGFIGHELPRGAKVGFLLDRDELRLVDEREEPLLRAPRPGLDADWVQAAKRLKGTMLVVLSGGHPDPALAPRTLADLVDGRAREGQVLGAIIGVVEERPNLPLLF